MGRDIRSVTDRVLSGGPSIGVRTESSPIAYGSAATISAIGFRAPV